MSTPIADGLRHTHAAHGQSTTVLLHSFAHPAIHCTGTEISCVSVTSWPTTRIRSAGRGIARNDPAFVSSSPCALTPKNPSQRRSLDPRKLVYRRLQTGPPGREDDLARHSRGTAFAAPNAIPSPPPDTAAGEPLLIVSGLGRQVPSQHIGIQDVGAARSQETWRDSARLSRFTGLRNPSCWPTSARRLPSIGMLSNLTTLKTTCLK